MQDCKYSHMNIDVMHCDRFGNVLELRFHTARSSDMNCVTLLEGRFEDAAELSFQDSKFRIWAAKRSISYFTEIAFSACKMFKYSSAILQDFRFADVRNRVFRLRNGEIWAALCCKMVVLLILRNRPFRLSHVQIWAVLSSNEVD